MASVTFPPALGGDGSTVTDDDNPTTGLANGGHRTRFVPSLAQMVAVAGGGVSQATAQVAAATAQANASAASASAAAASAASAVNSPGTNATSTSSVAIGTGSKTLTVQTGKNFVVGQPVMVARTSAAGTTWMAGNITAYNSGTGSLTVNVVWTVGSGTFTDWTVSLAGPANPSTALVAFAGTAADLNTIVTSGFYRLNASHPNAPASVDYGQLIVSRGGDTILQIVTGYNTGLIYFRHGNPSDVGGAGSWQPWRRMGNKPVRFVTDTNGYMYGETQGGLNTVNVVTYSANACLKYMPANPLPGDECTFIFANGRSDNALYVDPVVGSQRPIMGLNETMVVNVLDAYFTMVYVDPTYGWRLVS